MPQGAVLDEDEEEFGDEELPEYACAYCGHHEATSVVRCLETGRWFCNGRGDSSASHIIQHLVRSKYRQVFFSLFFEFNI